MTKNLSMEEQCWYVKNNVPYLVIREVVVDSDIETKLIFWLLWLFYSISDFQWAETVLHILPKPPSLLGRVHFLNILDD